MESARSPVGASEPPNGIYLLALALPVEWNRILTAVGTPAAPSPAAAASALWPDEKNQMNARRQPRIRAVSTRRVSRKGSPVGRTATLSLMETATATASQPQAHSSPPAARNGSPRRCSACNRNWCLWPWGKMSRSRPVRL